MKIQGKVTVGIIGALMSIALCASSASALYNCKNAVVGELGMRPSVATFEGSSDYAVYLHCEGWDNERRFFLSADLGESGYATLLTAKSLDKPVSAWMEEPAWNALITELVIIP